MKTSRLRRVLKALAWSATVSCTLACLAWLVMLGVGAQRLASARTEWKARGLDLTGSISPGGPAHAANASALQLEKLADQLGLSMAPFGTPRPQMDAQRKDGYKESGYRDWVKRTLYSGEDGVSTAIPTQQGAIYIESTPALLQIREHLLNAPTPEWDWDPDTTADGPPAPNLLATLYLHDLILAQALLAHGDDPEDAGHWLEAAWRMGEGLSKHPALISRLIAGAMHRRQWLVLRKWEQWPDPWPQRAAAYDPYAGILESVRTDVWFMDRHVQQVLDGDDVLTTRVKDFLVRPLLMMHWAKVLEAELASFDGAEAAGPCDLKGIDGDAVFKEQLGGNVAARGNVLREGFSGAGGPTDRARYYRLEALFALNILELRRFVKPPAGTQSNDLQLKPIEPACSLWPVQASMDPDGAVTIVVGGKPPRLGGDRAGKDPPWRHVIIPRRPR